MGKQGEMRDVAGDNRCVAIWPGKHKVRDRLAYKQVAASSADASFREHKGHSARPRIQSEAKLMGMLVLSDL